MIIYLMRHGHSPMGSAPSDSERPLSQEGRQAVKESILQVVSKNGRPTLILHSPMRRTRETAVEAAALIAPPPELESFPGLANTMSPPQACQAFLDRGRRHREILAVGHQPLLGEIAFHLTGEVLHLKPGSVAALETNGSGCRLLWTFPDSRR